MTPDQDQMARRLCQLLDSAADDLSPRIQSRLAAARGQALARLDEITRETGRAGRSRGTFPRLLAHALAGTGLVTAGAHRHPGHPAGPGRPGWQPLHPGTHRHPAADAYTEMLTADVPLSAYTDNGFAPTCRAA